MYFVVYLFLYSNHPSKMTSSGLVVTLFIFLLLFFFIRWLIEVDESTSIVVVYIVYIEYGAVTVIGRISHHHHHHQQQQHHHPPKNKYIHILYIYIYLTAIFYYLLKRHALEYETNVFFIKVNFPNKYPLKTTMCAIKLKVNIK